MNARPPGGLKPLFSSTRDRIGPRFCGNRVGAGGIRDLAECPAQGVGSLKFAREGNVEPLMEITGAPATG